jgi:hypothetical protein
MSRGFRTSLGAGAALFLACGLVACGSSNDPVPEPPQPGRLTAAERGAAEAGHAAIRSYCRRLGLHLAGRGAAPGEGAQRQALEGARTIARLARSKPEARFSAVQTTRQLAADTAEDLEGTNCSGRLVSELVRGL